MPVFRTGTTYKDMGCNICIVDYETGNIHSVYKQISRLNGNCAVSSLANGISKADKIILPGVGHFGKIMKSLYQEGLHDALQEAVTIKKKPVLGICSGMQLMCSFSEEGNAAGLGWFQGKVKRIRVDDHTRYKIPHVGWNTIVQKKESPLMKGIADNEEFYFVHSFEMQDCNAPDILNETQYEHKIVSAIERDNLFGVQYHPEKSHVAGDILLNNFITL